MKAHFFFSAAVFTAIISTFSCSSGDDGGNGSSSSGRDWQIDYSSSSGGNIQGNSSSFSSSSGDIKGGESSSSSSGKQGNNSSSSSEDIKGSSSSSSGGNISSSSSGEISIYCVIDFPKECVIGVTGTIIGIGEKCEYRGQSGYFQTECPSGYLIVSSSSSSSSAEVCVNSGSASCTAADNTETCYCSNGTMREYGILPTPDGKQYKTVDIGTQTWMAENLDYNTSGSKCYDNYDPANCTKYGRLYNWATAMALPSNCNSVSCSDQIQAKHKGVCPSGWHLPTQAEWEAMISYIGGNEIAGKKLKATSGWNNYSSSSGNGTNDYGFSALPGGIGSSNGSFDFVGHGSYWWSANEYNSNYVSSRHIYNDKEGAYRNNNDKSALYSVRCLQD